MTGHKKRKCEGHDLFVTSASNTEFGGPSNPTSSNFEAADLLSDGDDYSDPEWEPEHDIFMSHSGKQKDFTELVCKELERWGYSPFLDVRDDCLPKGKRFPELIFRAAKQCRVAILILSEDFFTNSKWPMLELEAFVDAQNESREKKLPEVYILPVYLRLTRKECTEDEQRRSDWLSKWKEWQELAARKGERPIDVHKWEAALKVLGPANGIAYEQSSREAGLIDRIVEAVRCLLPPPNIASDADIHAKDRICKSIIGKILKTKASSNGARVVGLYGMGGIGKTSFCKELCYRYYKEFEGKVFHAELGTGKSERELQEDVVRQFTNIHDDSLKLAKDSKVAEHLRNRMAGKKRDNKVFLALDNVWPESIAEAEVYVQQARYGNGSIVLVTARSVEILKSLQIDENDCLRMPQLDTEEARHLFLYHAAPSFQPQSDEDDKSIQYCLRKCRSTNFGEGVEHFHPLALKVLGTQMKRIERSPKKWVESLSEGNKFNKDRLKEHPLFVILGIGYDRLEPEDQLLFMDVALTHEGLGRLYSMTLYEWLSIVHGTGSDMSSIKTRLEFLKARALLEDIGDDLGRVIVHDLYREFAKFEANRGKLNDKLMVWPGKQEPTTYLGELVKTPPGGPDGCWSNVERVCIGCEWTGCQVEIPHWPRGEVQRIKWQHFANVVVLVLYIGSSNQVLDLRGLLCLRSLTPNARKNTVIGLGELRNLRWLDLTSFCFGVLYQEIGLLTELQVLRVRTFGDYMIGHCHLDWSRRTGDLQRLELLNLDNCINLRELEVRCSCLKALPDLGRMTSLRRAIFRCRMATDGPGLGSRLSALQELRLESGLFLCLLPRLGEAVTSLQVLEVRDCNEVKQFPEMRILIGLRELSICYCAKLLELPQLGELVALEVLKIANSPVRELPDMRLLTKLRRVSLVHCGHLFELPELHELVALEKLKIDNLPVRELPDMRLLTKLRRVSLRHCGHLLELPQLGELVALEELKIEDLVVGELPDIRALTKLRRVTLTHVGHLLELPGFVDLLPSQLRFFSEGFSNLSCHIYMIEETLDTGEVTFCACQGDDGYLCCVELEAELSGTTEKFIELWECRELSKSVIACRIDENCKGWVQNLVVRSRHLKSIS